MERAAAGGGARGVWRVYGCPVRAMESSRGGGCGIEDGRESGGGGHVAAVDSWTLGDMLRAVSGSALKRVVCKSEHAT